MTDVFSIAGTPEERAALVKMVYEDDSIYDAARDLFAQTAFLSRNSKTCFASNAYFAKYLNKSIRSVSRYISQLVKAGYLYINLIWKDGRVDKRIIALNISKLKERVVNKVKTAAEIFNRNVKTTTREFFRFMNNSLKMGNVYTCGVEKCFKDKEKKDLLYKYNKSKKSKKEKASRNSRPQNYDEVLKLWANKNLEGSPKAFWNYNTKRAWADIRNWKRAAKGWAKKAKDNLDVFKANKTENIQTTIDYKDILPKIPSFSLKDVDWF